MRLAILVAASLLIGAPVAAKEESKTQVRFKNQGVDEDARGDGRFKLRKGHGRGRADQAGADRLRRPDERAGEIRQRGRRERDGGI